ncbi:lysozyme [Aestuariirhabdus haliotis]|uniref:lysozyme n=1 Tax=Aestuariirhabdus haliotis TaxID=2918751 RepID=UPI0020BDF6FB|nr:lysozyme [Aestuariirhabdus haliotis]MCL6419408.1 lysozyme [Aestuariirhabdus haliotis]
MRHITQDGIDLIKRFEGFSSTVYICPAGYPTIGYGHLVRSGESFHEISETEAEELLRKDVESAERAVLRLVNVPLTDGQFDALVSFTFNLGSGALQRSTLRRKVNHQAHAEVPEQLMRWVWAGGRKLNGLIKRRNAEGVVYATPASGLKA